MVRVKTYALLYTSPTSILAVFSGLLLYFSSTNFDYILTVIYKKWSFSTLLIPPHSYGGIQVVLYKTKTKFIKYLFRRYYRSLHDILLPKAAKVYKKAAVHFRLFMASSFYITMLGTMRLCFTYLRISKDKTLAYYCDKNIQPSGDSRV